MTCTLQEVTCTLQEVTCTDMLIIKYVAMYSLATTQETNHNRATTLGQLTLILIFNDICCPSITGTTDTGGVMRGTER